MNIFERSRMDTAELIISDSDADDDDDSQARIKGKGKGKKDRVVIAEDNWPLVIQLVYEDGLKVRQQNPVIKTVIAEVIQCCELRMISKDAFPEMGKREEFRDKMVKLAIKLLCKKVVPNKNYIAAYHCARVDDIFVQRIGEVVRILSLI